MKFIHIRSIEQASQTWPGPRSWPLWAVGCPFPRSSASETAWCRPCCCVRHDLHRTRRVAVRGDFGGDSSVLRGGGPSSRPCHGGDPDDGRSCCCRRRRRRRCCRRSPDSAGSSYAFKCRNSVHKKSFNKWNMLCYVPVDDLPGVRV